MSKRSTALLSASLTLAAFAAIPAQARATAEAGIWASGLRASGSRQPTGLQLAQTYYYPDSGYAYPPGYYYQRPPQTDGWGWTGRGWGDRYSGGWNNGSGNAWGGGGPPGNGNAWGGGSWSSGSGGGGGYGGHGNRW